MTERPRTVVVLHVFLLDVWLRNSYEPDDEEGCDEYCHTDEEERSNVAHTGVGCNSTYEHTCQQWGKSTTQRVQCTTNLNELVTTVTTATEQVQHWVYHRVKHTYAETADECTQQINDEVEANCARAECEYWDVVTEDA